ncbi:Uncharacterised protein [Mycobacteroides abscessus subsp. abscessus]|nr:Uncharacterised protein [Mycobacteroides abscessus subsp. abscessus]
MMERITGDEQAGIRGTNLDRDVPGSMSARIECANMGGAVRVQHLSRLHETVRRVFQNGQDAVLVDPAAVVLPLINGC